MKRPYLLDSLPFPRKGFLHFRLEIDRLQDLAVVISKMLLKIPMIIPPITIIPWGENACIEIITVLLSVPRWIVIGSFSFVKSLEPWKRKGILILPNGGIAEVEIVWVCGVSRLLVTTIDCPGKRPAPLLLRIILPSIGNPPRKDE